MSKFSQDKNALLKTLTRFDGNITVDEVTNPEDGNVDTTNHTFLLHVVLEALCGMVEQDGEKRLHLFNGVLGVLAKSKILNQQIVLDGLMPMRRKMAFKLLEIVKEVLSTVEPSPVQDLFYIEFMNSLDSSKYSNKYEQTFEELKVIASGGFGTVCMAKHKFDGMIYAVKKITFKYSNDSDYTKVIREVKSIATLNHHNVVSYNSAWIEPFEKSNKSSSHSEESSPESKSERLNWSKRKKSKARSVHSLNLSSKNSNLCCRSSQLKKDSFSSDALLPKLRDTNINQGIFGEILKKKYKSHQLSFQSMSHCTETSASSFSTDSASHVHSKCKDSQRKLKLDKENDSFLSAVTWKLQNMNLKVVLYIQMEYCNCDLRLWLDQRTRGETLPFQMDELNIFKNILNGVAHIHSKSIIHRDLKPQNIFFSTKDNVLKIGDFGLATLGGSSPHRQMEYSSHYSSDLGTLPYAAPEQRSRHNYDNKVDIYSLGIILIELLIHFTTQMEFSKTIDSIVKGNLPTELVANWPDYASLVQNLVQKNPALRMSAKEILCVSLLQEKGNHELEKQNMNDQIEDLKKTLVEKEKIIKILQSKVKEQACIIANQQQQIEEHNQGKLS